MASSQEDLEWPDTPLGNQMAMMEEDLGCPICKSIKESGIMKLPCNHSFCSICIRTSLQSVAKCPSCKVEANLSQLRKDVSMSNWSKRFSKLRKLVHPLALQQQQQQQQQPQARANGEDEGSEDDEVDEDDEDDPDFEPCTVSCKRQGLKRASNTVLANRELTAAKRKRPVASGSRSFGSMPAYKSMGLKRVRKMCAEEGFGHRTDGLDDKALTDLHKKLVLKEQVAMDIRDGEGGDLPSRESLVEELLKERKVKRRESLLGKKALAAAEKAINLKVGKRDSFQGVLGVLGEYVPTMGLCSWEDSLDGGKLMYYNKTTGKWAGQPPHELKQELGLSDDSDSVDKNDGSGAEGEESVSEAKPSRSPKSTAQCRERVHIFIPTHSFLDRQAKATAPAHASGVASSCVASKAQSPVQPTSSKKKEERKPTPPVQTPARATNAEVVDLSSDASGDTWAKGWACPLCTFHHEDAGTSKCQLCLTPNPNASGMKNVLYSKVTGPILSMMHGLEGPSPSFLVTALGGETGLAQSQMLR
ncbi:unnamed protein product [Chrysoparadoxa australica]